MNLNECVQWFRNHDDYLILTHSRPDGDTLCSAAALCRGLRRIGKRAFLYENTQMTSFYIPYVMPFYAPPEFEPRSVVSVDTASDGLFPVGWSGHVDICIDHHPSNDGHADHLLCWPDKASCGEVVIQVIKQLCGELDLETAELLYIAVATDTGCFVYGNTTGDTLRAAAELIDLGVNNKLINRSIFRTFSKARLTLEGMMLTGIKQFRGGKINVATVTLDMMDRARATEDDCEDLASIAGKIKGSRVGITIREVEPGRCKISIRTGDEVNANAVCAKFGGGGHAMASGCTIDADPDTACELIVAAVNEVWK